MAAAIAWPNEIAGAAFNEILPAAKASFSKLGPIRYAQYLLPISLPADQGNMRTRFQPKTIPAATDTTPTRSFPLRFFAVCALAFSLAATAVAGPIQMQFVAVNGTQAFGDYVGPYSGTINGTPVALFCVDFANEVNIGQQWDANLTPVSSDALLSDTRYGTAPGGLDLYQQAAWLTLQFASQPTTQFGDIQATIWRLFSTTAPTPSSGVVARTGT
jgi:hypothetical protein